MAQASRRAHQVAGAGVDREDIYGASEEECSEDKIGRGGGVVRISQQNRLSAK